VPAEPAKPEEAVVEIELQGISLIVKKFKRASKRGKRDIKGNVTKGTQSFTIDIKNTTDKPIYSWRADLAFAGYGGIVVYKLPWEHTETMEPGATLVVEHVFKETVNPSSPYQSMLPLGNDEISIALVNVGPLFEEIKLPSHPPFKDVITGPLLDQAVGQNQSLIQCFVVAMADGMKMDASMEVGFTVHPDGHVDTAHVVNEGYGGTPLEACVIEQLELMYFDPFEGLDPHILKYPFRTR